MKNIKDIKIKDETIREWYMKTYPTDDMGSDIKKDCTFEGLYNAMKNGQDFYSYTQAYDSIIRERVFSQLAKLKGVKYDVIYDLWARTSKYYPKDSIKDSRLDPHHIASYLEVWEDGSDVGFDFAEMKKSQAEKTLDDFYTKLKQEINKMLETGYKKQKSEIEKKSIKDSIKQKDSRQTDIINEIKSRYPFVKIYDLQYEKDNNGSTSLAFKVKVERKEGIDIKKMQSAIMDIVLRYGFRQGVSGNIINNDTITIKGYKRATKNDSIKGGNLSFTKKELKDLHKLSDALKDDLKEEILKKYPTSINRDYWDYMKIREGAIYKTDRYSGLKEYVKILKLDLNNVKWEVVTKWDNGKIEKREFTKPFTDFILFLHDYKPVNSMNDSLKSFKVNGKIVKATDEIDAVKKFRDYYPLVYKNKIYEALDKARLYYNAIGDNVFEFDTSDDAQKGGMIIKNILKGTNHNCIIGHKQVRVDFNDSKKKDSKIRDFDNSGIIKKADFNKAQVGDMVVWVGESFPDAKQPMTIISKDSEYITIRRLESRDNWKVSKNFFEQNFKVW